MASIEDQLTTIYCFVDDFLKAHPACAQWRRSPNATPLFTDAEVITIGLMQGCLKVATLKDTYRVIAGSYRQAFPHLCSYGQWIARLHALTEMVGRLIHEAVKGHFMDGDLYLIDSKPIPVCKPIRHGRVRLLTEAGAYFGKTSVGWFYGFKLHLLTHADGTVLGAILTPGNWGDRDPVVALAWIVDGGVTLADLGYPGKAFEATLLEEADMLLITPKHAGDDAPRRALISSLRERIEATFSGLSDRFVDRVRSRSWEGLWNSIKLKLVSYNLFQAGLVPA